MNNNPSFRAPTAGEINEMRADLVAAHLHISHIHRLLELATKETPDYPEMRVRALRRAVEVAKDWEESQCL